MTPFDALLSPTDLALAFAVAGLAGTIKGLVGFAMPMILMSGLGMFLSPELALAGLILPTLVTNGMQALQHGLGSALASVRRYAVFLGIGLVFLLGSAQLVLVLPATVILLLIGIPITGFALMQLLGLHFTLTEPSRRIEVAFGAVAGFIGGLSGIWGPPTVAYLTALNTPKAEQMRVQGVIYGLGAVALLMAHTSSGVIRGETLPFSLALVIPSVLGMWLGRRLQNRIDQNGFRRATLVVLLIAGLNLMRLGIMG
ncbi:MAG: putative membrane protein YfcA [Paracoccaceae bacterium]|jgi:uncharacterized membrane protein YfcA